MIEPGKGVRPETNEWFLSELAMQHRTTNGLASWSLIMALLWGFGIFSVVAIMFGHEAKRQCRQRGQDGAGIAAAGLFFGYLGLAVPVTLLFLFVVGMVTV